MSTDVEAVRHSELLSACSQAEIDDVLARSSEQRLPAGQLLFTEDDKADAVWVLLDGELAITKLSNGDEVILDHLTPGAFLGEISLLTATPAEHRARAKTDARLLRIPGDVFYDLLKSCVSVSQTVLRTMAERVRRIEHLLQQRERMAGLGTLAAGLAHELNNPASAANRAVQLLKEQIGGMDDLAQKLARHQWTPGELGLLKQLHDATRQADSKAQELSAIERNEREEALSTWLDRHGIARAWEFAPLLVDRGVTMATLDGIARGCDPAVLSDAFAWSQLVTSIRQLLDEAAQSTMRMTGMVKAVKAYAYVDASTLRSADVHEGLENSLTILAHRLRQAGATVERAYDKTIPPIQTYGTELGQVWTNLLDNAADALDGTPGKVRIRTARDGDAVTVEIADTGGGIPKDVLPDIFDPFFTTKAAGKGTGLGLEIVKRIIVRHKGSISVTSVPGDTRFTVRLPLAQTPSDNEKHAP